MNILFLMTDQQRYDCVGYAQDAKVATPNIDRLAEGCVFSHCQTVNPVCQPTRTALLTGKYAHQIGTLRMSGDLNLDHPTFPQALQRAGFWTAGVGKFHYLQPWQWTVERGCGVPLKDLHPEMESLGYNYVWETSGKQLASKNYCDYCDYLEEHNLLEPYRDMVDARGLNTAIPGEELSKDGDAWPFDEKHHIDIVTGRKIREAISERPKDRPFFVFGSFCSPHKPFDPPQRFLDEIPYEEMDDFLPGEEGALSDADKKHLWKLRRAYKATIRLVDEEIGKILDQLETEGLMEDTLIVFTSDHGELMGDHYRVQKSAFWRESLNVPLAIRHPNHLNAATNDSPVEITDITATILDVAGLDSVESLSRSWPAFNNIVPCQSLLPILSNEAEAIRDFAFSEFSNEWQCIVSQRFKYVRYLAYEDPDDPAECLFDMDVDPAEQHNLIKDPAYRDEADWHRRRLQFTLDKTPPAQHSWAPLMG